MDPKSYRVSKNLTLAQMAEKLGIGAPAISMLERGTRKPSGLTAEKYRILSKGKVRLQDFPAMGNQ
jgi:transcriptional regulator with XRE-family HTH domain